MTALLLSRAHYPVTALGPGTRAGIWTQGCTIGCPGCLAHDTWDADPDAAVAVEVVLGWLASLPEPVDGVTVSGGEPFQQPEALTALLHGVQAWRAARPRTADIMVYSGYPLSALRRRAPARAALDLCDIVVTGPYVDRRNLRERWRGSANQRIVPLTDLGRRRLADAGEPDGAPAIQVSVEDDRIYVIGIPGRGDMERLSAGLAREGVIHGEVSWRP